MSHVLVTGGAGFIGSHLVDALLARGDSVRVFDNFTTGNASTLDQANPQLEIVRGDLTDPDAVAQAVEGMDLVFHEAALSSVPRSVERPLDTHAACVTGTLNVLDSARRAGVRRMVYAASSSAYGDQPTSSKRETDLPAPISPYGAAKLAGEMYCQAFTATYGFETVSLRYFNVFGPRQDPGSPYSAVIPLFITSILKGQRPKIYGDGHQSRDFCYVGNVVHANLLAAEAEGAAGKVFNVACGQSISLLELLGQINRLLGTNVEAAHEPARAGDVRDSLADISQARRVLGYEPLVGFSEGLERSIAYYRDLVAAG